MRVDFDAVVSKLEVLRAGRLGIVALGRPTALANRDALAGPARVWESRTFYLATRHASRGKDKKAALIRDVAAECERRGLPRPIEVEILEFAGVANGGGLRARARLRFATAIQGPLLLGRDSHQGGGVFFCLGGGGGADNLESVKRTAVVI
jgi:CRISPR-associated protein Csb2